MVEGDNSNQERETKLDMGFLLLGLPSHFLPCLPAGVNTG